MANNVGRLGVVLGLDTAEFIVGLETAGKALEKFGNAVEKYGKMGITAMAAAGLQALSFADELNDVAKANDTTIESVLKLQEALATNGGEAENAGKILAGFTKYVDEAAHGSMDAQKRLASMGITLKDIATLGTQELFNKALAGSSNITDSLTRQANAYAVFGKSIKGVDIKGLNEDFIANNAILEEQAKRIADAAEVWDELKKRSLESSATIASAIGPSLNALIQYLSDAQSGTSILGEAFRITFETIAVVGANVAFVIEGIARDIYQLYQNTKLFFQLDFSGISANNKKNLDEFDARLKKLQEFEQRVLGTQGGNAPDTNSNKSKPSTVGGRPVIDAYAKETAQLTAKLALQQKLYDIDQQVNALHLESIDGEKTYIDLKNNDLQLEKELATIANARAQALSNEKLTVTQKSLINKDFDLQSNRAIEKAANNAQYIKDMNEKILGLYAEQAITRQIMLDVDKEIGNQQLAAMNMDKLQVDTEANGLQLKKEILRINRQQTEDLEKSGLSQIERGNILAKAEDDRAKAVQAFQQTNAVVTRQYQEQLEAVGRLKLAQDEAYEFDVRRQILEQNKYHMRQDEIKLAEEEIASEQKIADLLRQQMEARRTMGAGALGDAEAQRIDDLIAKEKQLSEVRKKAIKDEYARTKSFSEGWNDAYRKYIENSTNAAEVGGRAFNSVMGNMESALDNFVDTGKLSFSDLANSIIKDLIKIELKAQATQLMGGLLGSGGGGGLMGMIGGLFSGGGGGGGIMGAIGSIGSMFGFADGGTPPTNVPSIVGERGPELFVPKTAGTVIPNNQLASALGGGGQTVNYNGPFIASMSAIDTQSGVQFLAKNKQTIWASYQSANRSVPVSR